MNVRPSDGRPKTQERHTMQVVERPSDAASASARQIRGLREDSQDHVRGVEDSMPIPMRRDKAQETVQAFHRAQCRNRLFACEGTGGRQDAGVHQTAIVEEVANGHLQVLPLGGGSGGLGVGGGNLRGGRSESWGGVHGRRVARLNAFRAKTSEEGVGVPGV